MYKQVKVPGIFGQRPRIVTIMVCDGEGCGKQIHWCQYHLSGKHYCEKCFKKLNVNSENK